MKTMEVAELQTNIVAIMADVASHQEAYTFVSDGVPVAKLEPVAPVRPLVDADGDPLARLRFPGTITIVGDILKPLYTDEELETFFEESMRQIEGR